MYITLQPNGDIYESSVDSFPGSTCTEKDVIIGWDGNPYFFDDPRAVKPKSVVDEERIAEIKSTLAVLDDKYLPPRTVTDMVLGVPEALERKKLHEEAAAPLRQELKALQGAEADQGAV